MGGERRSDQELANELNELLEYARGEVDSTTNEGAFKFGYSMNHRLAKRADSLRAILIAMKFVENRSNGGRVTTWWINPRGNVTAALVKKHRDQARDTSTEAQLRAEVSRWRARATKAEAKLKRIHEMTRA